MDGTRLLSLNVRAQTAKGDKVMTAKKQIRVLLTCGAVLRSLTIGLLMGLAYSLPVHANGAGAGCYAKGYLVYDDAHRDPKGLYFVFYGKGAGLSNLVRVELPYSPRSSSGIECRDESVTIALRGAKRKADDWSEFDIYYIEISTSNPPSIIRSLKNHIERWTAYTKKVLVSVNASFTPIRLLPRAAFRFGGLRDGEDVLLQLHSDDPHHEYILEMTEKVVRENGCPYFHTTHNIVQKDKNDRVLRRLILNESKRTECDSALILERRARKMAFVHESQASEASRTIAYVSKSHFSIYQYR